MDASDFDEFADRLTVLAEHWQRSLSSAQLVMDFEALADLPTDRVFAAFTQALQGCTFWPSIAEIRKLALGDDDLHVERAWMTFRRAMTMVGAYRSLALFDAALGETITAMFGGWPQACAADLSPEMWTATRKEFDRVYRVCLGRQPAAPCYLTGLIERDNGARVEWANYLQIAVVNGQTIEFLTGRVAAEYRQTLTSGTGLAPAES